MGQFSFLSRSTFCRKAESLSSIFSFLCCRQFQFALLSSFLLCRKFLLTLFSSDLFLKLGVVRSLHLAQQHRGTGRNSDGSASFDGEILQRVAHRFGGIDQKLPLHTEMLRRESEIDRFEVSVEHQDEGVIVDFLSSIIRLFDGIAVEEHLQ